MEQIKEIDIAAYRLANTPYDDLFGIYSGIWYQNTYPNVQEETTKFEEEINILNVAGKLEIVYRMEIGDECYFWNIEDKMDAHVDGGPIIGIFEGMQETQYRMKDSHFVFKMCEKVNNIKGDS